MDLKVKPVTALFLQKNPSKRLASHRNDQMISIKYRDHCQIQVEFSPYLLVIWVTLS